MHKRAGFGRPASDGREIRQLRRELAGVRREKRASGDGDIIRGIAAVYYRDGHPGTEYWLWDDMVERIQPGAFDRAIKESHDARAVFNHDHSQLLGRVSSGSCRLSLPADGLAYEIDVDPTDPDHLRVCSKIDRSDVTGSSFMFVARKVTWEEQKLDDGKWIYIRNVLDVDLYDVGPVTWPAYEGTTAGRSQQRSAAGAGGEFAELVQERETHLRGADDEAIRMRLRSISV